MALALVKKKETSPALCIQRVRGRFVLNSAAPFPIQFLIHTIFQRYFILITNHGALVDVRLGYNLFGYLYIYLNLCMKSYELK